MTDLSWLSTEAHKIHDIFYGLFYLLATVMLLIGVAVEYFKLPLGGSANFSNLIGRCLVATLLLISYPEIVNWIADIGDGLAESIGGLNSLDTIVDKTSLILKEKSWSWTNMGDTLLWIISYFVYSFLYLTVFIFDAIILYGWTLLYIFSPILILMFILPQTAGATALLFRSHIELASYKVVWSALGTLLWSTAINNLDDNLKDHPNFFVMLGFMVLVAFSILLTPKIVGALTKSGVSGVSSGLGALGAASLTAGAIGPAGLSKVMTGPITVPTKKGSTLVKNGFNKARQNFSRKSNQQRTKRNNKLKTVIYAKANKKPPTDTSS